MTQATSLTASQAVQKIATGTLSATALTEACIATTETHEPQVGAWAHFDPDKPRMAARLADASQPKGPLHGVPFGVKDIIETVDMPTGYGTPIYNNHQGARDAACVALLKEAGAIVFGKNVTTELAHFHPGKTRNPHRATHTPGGSSSGSAAAVAAHMVPFALGTQTTGSVLRPASYCGVYGFKPSFGDVIRSGVFECATSFDHVGWFARSVADIELVRRALVRLPHLPLAEVELRDLRIGMFRSPWWDRAETNTREQIEGAARALMAAGASVADVAVPDGFANLGALHKTIAGFEFARAISFERVERGHLLSQKLLEGRCGDGLAATYDEYIHAQEAVDAARRAFRELMHNYDALITPAAPGEAWEGLAATGDPIFNLAWTTLHVPAISIPAFKGPSGLPVGLQVVGAYRKDAEMLAAAEAIAKGLGARA